MLEDEATTAKYIFVMSPDDMREFFLEWPIGICLAVLREADQDSYYLFPEENLLRDLRKIGGEDIAVFPAVSGLPRARVSFADENEIINWISQKSDLLNHALKIRARLDGPPVTEKPEEGIAAPDGGDAAGAQGSDTREGAPASALKLVGSPLLQSFSEDPALGNPLLLHVYQDSMTIKVRRQELLREDADYFIAFDREHSRILLYPASQPLEGVRGRNVLRTEGAGETVLFMSLSDEDRDFLQPLGRMKEEVSLPLVAQEDGIVVSDLAAVLADRQIRRVRKESLISLCAVLVLSIMMIGFIFSHAVQTDYSRALSVSDEAPSFQTSDYIDNMLGRWFSK